MSSHALAVAVVAVGSVVKVRHASPKTSDTLSGGLSPPLGGHGLYRLLSISPSLNPSGGSGGVSLRQV